MPSNLTMHCTFQWTSAKDRFWKRSHQLDWHWFEVKLLNVSFERFKCLDGKGFYRRAAGAINNQNSCDRIWFERNTHTCLAKSSNQKVSVKDTHTARNDTFAKGRKTTLTIFSIKLQLHLDWLFMNISKTDVLGTLLDWVRHECFRVTLWRWCQRSGSQGRGRLWSSIKITWSVSLLRVIWD